MIDKKKPHPNIVSNYSKYYHNNLVKYFDINKKSDFISLDVISVPRNPDIDFDRDLNNCNIYNLTEEDYVPTGQTKQLDKNRIALILIDVWNCHYIKGYNERMKTIRDNQIVELIDIARKNNIPIVFASYTAPLSDNIKPQKGELVSTDLKEILEFLKEHNIKTLLYGGFATNHCIMYRPAGIINMHYNYNYEIILVRDATLAFETAVSYKDELAQKIAVMTVEFVMGCSTSIKDLKNAFASIHKYKEPK